MSTNFENSEEKLFQTIKKYNLKEHLNRVKSFDDIILGSYRNIYHKKAKEIEPLFNGSFVFLPIDLHKNKKIQSGAKIMFSEMWLLCFFRVLENVRKHDIDCIAKTLNISTKTKNSWLKKLEEEGWIKKQGYEYICFNKQQKGGK